MYSTQRLENTTFASIVFWGMGVSSLFFLQDVMFDVRDHLVTGEGYILKDLIHLIFEIVAVIVLFFGMVLMSIYISELRRRARFQARKLTTLRDDFDSHIHQLFKKWSLTPKEAEVALLLIRGLSTQEIANYRQCTTGTVKVHSHHVFRKAGVSSRVELMSLFLDEFMDIGLSQSQQSGPSPV